MREDTRIKLASSTRIQKTGRECRDFWDLYIGGDRAPPGDVDHRRMEPERETEQHQPMSITVAWNPSGTQIRPPDCTRAKNKKNGAKTATTRAKKRNVVAVFY